jgi:hypothetical protein
MGQQTGDDGAVPEASAEAGPLLAARADESAMDGDASAAPAGPAPDDDGPPPPHEERPLPAPLPTISLRWLLLVTVVNLALAAGLLTLRPPWRVERADVPPALPPQVADLQARVQRGEHGAAYALTLSDEDLTATAGYFLAQRQDVPFGQVRVAVADDHVEANGVTTGLAVAVPVRVRATVQARDGRPVVQVADVNVGGLVLPDFARQQVLDEANRAVDLSRYDLPVTVESVTLRPGALDVRGVVK